MMQDLHDLFEIVLRIGLRLAAFGIACAFLYQAYDAGRSALLGVQPNASAPSPDPKAVSSRFGAVAWGMMALTIALVSFATMIFGGEAVLDVVMSPFPRN
jgi:hypothetical protein